MIIIKLEYSLFLQLKCTIYVLSNKIKRILEYVQRHYLNNFNDKNIVCMNEWIIKINLQTGEFD